MEDSVMSQSDDEDCKPAAITDPTTLINEHEHHVKVKPALKKDPNSGSKHKPSSADKHLKWDEPTIEEHDLLRGTRMKIDEPNTPYTNYDSGAESDDSRRPKSPANQKQTLSWDTLQTRLDSVAAVREQYPSSPSAGNASSDQSDHNSDVDEEHKREMRKLEFKEHRKRHYNEMELVKKFRQEHSDDDDVDGVLEDDHKKNNNGHNNSNNNGGGSENDDAADDADDEAGGNVSE